MESAVKRHPWILALAIPALALALSGCGAGSNQNPVASDEQLATTHPADAFQDVANTYTTRLGDTLSSIAGRPEVYGEPDLWPLLADANGDRIKDPDGSSVLPEDLLLDIPRGLEGVVLDMARERARSAQAQTKASAKPHRKAKAKASTEASATAPKPQRTAVKAEAKVEPAVEPAVEPSPVPTAVSAAVEKPKPKSQRSVFPLFMLLLLLLAALGAILAYFLKRDKQEGA